jgi:multicomponent Na+:H+ antiporter subunit C
VNLALPILIGALFATGAYLIMRRSIVKLLFGLLILGNATNLLIFTSARLVRGRPPIVPEGQTVPAPPYADPLGQALILTAIVISFGLLAFAFTLVKKTYQAVGDDDLDTLDGGRLE